MTTAEKIAAAKKRIAELELLIKLWTKKIKKNFPLVWNKSKTNGNIPEGALWIDPNKPDIISIFKNGEWQEKK